MSPQVCPSSQEPPVRFRIRPVDTSFYDLFTESANHLVGGVSLLAEMLSDTADREDVARRMRDAEHAADESTHEIVKKATARTSDT